MSSYMKANSALVQCTGKPVAHYVLVYTRKPVAHYVLGYTGKPVAHYVVMHTK